MKQDFPRIKLSHDSYATDEWIMKLFDGWFDPCPLNPTWIIDGLELEWESKTFVNPPYSNPLPWVKKGIYESQRGNTIVFLLKHDSSTKWYQLLHEAGARFLPIQGRLKYGTNKTAAFPSVLVVL
jgi:hypothetical protein